MAGGSGSGREVQFPHCDRPSVHPPDPAQPACHPLHPHHHPPLQSQHQARIRLHSQPRRGRLRARRSGVGRREPPLPGGGRALVHTPEVPRSGGSLALDGLGVHLQHWDAHPGQVPVHHDHLPVQLPRHQRQGCHRAPQLLAPTGWRVSSLHHILQVKCGLDC